MTRSSASWLPWKSFRQDVRTFWNSLTPIWAKVLSLKQTVQLLHNYVRELQCALGNICFRKCWRSLSPPTDQCFFCVKPAMVLLVLFAISANYASLRAYAPSETAYNTEWNLACIVCICSDANAVFCSLETKTSFPLILYKHRTHARWSCF